MTVAIIATHHRIADKDSESWLTYAGKQDSSNSQQLHSQLNEINFSSTWLVETIGVAERQSLGVKWMPISWIIKFLLSLDNKDIVTK